jgi:hypothetical protein
MPPKQHNTRDENEAIKAGKTPEGWDGKPAKNAQKDNDARWTKKNDESFYGYKNRSVSTTSTRSFGAMPNPTRLFATAKSLMRSWTSPTPATRCGPTAPTGRQNARVERKSIKSAYSSRFPLDRCKF